MCPAEDEKSYKFGHYDMFHFWVNIYVVYHRDVRKYVLNLQFFFFFFYLKSKNIEGLLLGVVMRFGLIWSGLIHI